MYCLYVGMSVVPEVASSRKMTLGSLNSCRAIVNFFCPLPSPAQTVRSTTVSAGSCRPVSKSAIIIIILAIILLPV